MEGHKFSEAPAEAPKAEKRELSPETRELVEQAQQIAREMREMNKDEQEAARLLADIEKRMLENPDKPHFRLAYNRLKERMQGLHNPEDLAESFIRKIERRDQN